MTREKARGWKIPAGKSPAGKSLAGKSPAGKIPFAAFSFIRCNANLMHMIAALAFVLPDDGESAFYALSDIMPEEGTDTLNYFEDTYIRRQIRRTRRAPLLFSSIAMEDSQQND